MTPTPDDQQTQASPAAEEEARTPDEMREDIEQTREELGDTVASLAEKADVKGQVHQRVDATRENIRETGRRLTSHVRNATPSTAQEGGRQVAAKVRRRPLPAAVAGAALIAFALGRRSGRRAQRGWR